MLLIRGLLVLLILKESAFHFIDDLYFCFYFTDFDSCLYIRWKLMCWTETFSFSNIGISSVQLFSRPHELQHARPPCPSPTPGVHSDSHPSSPWCHPAISSLVIPFSSCPQSFPALESSYNFSTNTALAASSKFYLLSFPFHSAQHTTYFLLNLLSHGLLKITLISKYLGILKLYLCDWFPI